MKKLILPSILALFLLATAPFNYANSTTVPKELGEHNSIEMLIDNLPDAYAGEIEQEAKMDFDVNLYLPKGFDAYEGMIIDESYALIEQAIPFSFDVNEYLPANFDVYQRMIIEEPLEEEAIPFDFNIEDYLPANFNAQANCKQNISM